MVALLLLMAAQCTYTLASGVVSPQSPDPASWPGYSNHSCHAVGPHARTVDISNATHAQCAAACAKAKCLCYDMLEAVGGRAGGAGFGGAGGTCRGTIDGVLRTSPDRIAYTNSTVPPSPPTPPGPSPRPRPPPPPPPGPPSPLEIKYSTLLNKTCRAAAQAIPVLPTVDSSSFLAAYRAFNGTQNETDTIKLADVLLSRPDVANFLAGEGGAAVDADLVLCAVLFEATPAGLAAFAGQGKSQEALLEGLLGDTVLMRDMLLAGGAKDGQYGQAMSIYTELTKASAVRSTDTASAAATGVSVSPWDDRTQNKTAILRRLALGTAVEHAVPVGRFLTQIITPPWGPTSDPNATEVDPLTRYLYYEGRYLAGDLDPGFEVLTAFEMRHVSNSPAADADLTWLRETMANTRPDNIAQPARGSGLADYSWRYSMAVHTDVNYGHPACATSPGICTGHYTQIPAVNGECGPRAFFGRLSRRAFGLPVWGATQPGHAAMTSWSPSGWSIMLGATWKYCWWRGQGGEDFHLDTLNRALRPQFEKVLRGGWAANARGEVPVDPSWSSRTFKGFGKGGLWSALMLYQKKAVVAAASFPNGTSSIPARHVGPSVVPTKVGALIAKWPVKLPAPKVTTGADGTMTIPAAALVSTASKAVEVMKSFAGGEQLLHADTDPNTSAVVYEVTVDAAGTRYLTVNHSTWHVDQYLMVAVNAARKPTNIPIYYTIGYWNESLPVPVELVAGKNTLTFTRPGSFAPHESGAGRMGDDAVARALGTGAGGGTELYQGLALKEFFLFRTKPDVRPPPGNYTPRPVPDTSDYILESPSTTCVRQGIIDVPAEFCAQACAAVGNKRKFAGTKSAANVSGCFVFTEGPEDGNCYFNSNTSAACSDPPCAVAGITVAELCLRK